MKNSHGFSNLVSHLGRTKTGGLTSSRVPQRNSLINSGSSHVSASAKPPTSKDSRSESVGAIPNHSLHFGSRSSHRTSASRSSSEWASLLQKTATGGLSNAIGGEGLLSMFGGVGGLVSGITGLFGGGGSSNTPPPLSLFSLPGSQNQGASVNAKAQSGVVSSAGSVSQGAFSVSVPADHQHAYQLQSAQIAQAVKHALLNSSSLNDVIAEI